jgi:hypothetical protein
VQFQIDGTNQTFSLDSYYSKTYNSTVYELLYSASSKPSSITVKITLIDFRGIKVIGKATLPVKTA